MTKLIITLILAYAEYLNALEAHKRQQASRATNPTRVCYIHTLADEIANSRATLEAMVRLYLAQNRNAQHTQQRRKAA